MTDNSQEKKISDIPRITTFENDLKETMKMGGVSTASIYIAEQKKSLEQNSKTDGNGAQDFFSNPKKRFVAIIVATLLLTLFGYLTYKIFFSSSKNSNNSSVVFFEHAIKTDYQKEISIKNIDGSALRNTLKNERRNVAIPVSSILGLNFTKEISPKIYTEPSEFLTTLSPKIPPELLRALDSRFTVGLHALNGNQPFMLFTISSYENAFSGMIRWESNLVEDIQGVFTDANTSGKKFTDLSVHQFDTRIISSNTSKPILIYTFLDKKYLLITSNTDTLLEIAKRVGVKK